MKPKVVVSGAAGRMGKRIIAVAVEQGKLEIIGAVEKGIHPDIGKDAGLVASAGQLGIEITGGFPPGADLVIDFSLPEAADKTIDYCSQNNAALVLGTTGLSDSQHEKVESLAKKVAVIYGSNMSAGMNLLFSLVGKVATLLGNDYDVEIIEQHHRFKKDAPSGSALTLARNICKALGKPFPDSLVHGRAGKEVQREKGAIGIHAVRAGDITGIHSVLFSSLGETITLNHTSHSRDTFARGALRAAEWLLKKEHGHYTMADVLGIEQ